MPIPFLSKRELFELVSEEFVDAILSGSTNRLDKSLWNMEKVLNKFSDDMFPLLSLKIYIFKAIYNRLDELSFAEDSVFCTYDTASPDVIKFIDGKMHNGKYVNEIRNAIKNNDIAFFQKWYMTFKTPHKTFELGREFLYFISALTHVLNNQVAIITPEPYEKPGAFTNILNVANTPPDVVRMLSKTLISKFVVLRQDLFEQEKLVNEVIDSISFYELIQDWADKARDFLTLRQIELLSKNPNIIRQPSGLFKLFAPYYVREFMATEFGNSQHINDFVLKELTQKFEDIAEFVKKSRKRDSKELINEIAQKFPYVYIQDTSYSLRVLVHDILKRNLIDISAFDNISQITFTLLGFFFKDEIENEVNRLMPKSVDGKLVILVKVPF